MESVLSFLLVAAFMGGLGYLAIDHMKRGKESILGKLFR